MKHLLFIVLLLITLFNGCSKEGITEPEYFGTLSGKIIEHNSTNPVKNAVILSLPDSTIAHSNDEGKFYFEKLRHGDHQLSVEAEGYFGKNITVQVTAKTNIDIDVILEKLPPDPIASFTISGAPYTPANVSFTNTSVSADSFVWEFNDGLKYYTENFQRILNVMGYYTITLTAKNSRTNKTDDTTAIFFIKPGNAIIEKVSLDEIPLFREDSTSWDPDSGPDVFISLADSIGNDKITPKTIIHNVNQESFPIDWFPERYLFRLTEWYNVQKIKIYDSDSNDISEEIGITQGFRLYELENEDYKTNISLQSENGKIKLRILIRWE